MKQPWLRRAFVLLPMIGVLAGCAGKSPDATQLAGAWEGPGGATFILSANHHLIVKNVPARDLLPGESTRPLSGEGRWVLGQAPGQSGLLKGVSWWDIDLNLPSADGYPKGLETQVHYTAEDRTPVLFVWVDEEGGDRVEFHRQP